MTANFLRATIGLAFLAVLAGAGPSAAPRLELAWVDTSCQRLWETTSLVVDVTGYSSTSDQTDDTPFLTATGTRVRPGVLAVSRDLLELLPYGTRVYVVEDTMHPRMRKTVDLWFPSRGMALRWGRQMGILDIGHSVR